MSTCIANSQQKATTSNETYKRSNIASFNVRGLVKPEKRLALMQDLASYQIDICCLQETKVSEHSDENINDFRLILLPSKSRHYGLGFAMNKLWADRLLTYESISDRIAIAVFRLSKRSIIKVINVYAPTMALTTKYPRVREEVYEQLEGLMNKCNQYTFLFIAGDFNSKLGAEQTNLSCLGHYGRGRRNENGQHLGEFAAEHNLIASNTLFQHRASHRTTWKGSRRDVSTGEIVPIYNQIDYIFVPERQVNLLTNARSYSGTAVESDHRIVVATTLILPAYKLYTSKRQLRQEKYEVWRLASDEIHRDNYRSNTSNKIENITSNKTAFEKWVEIRNGLKNAAKETIGTVRKKTTTTRCPKLEQLSKHQKDLKIRLENTKCQLAKQMLKTERNRTLNKINQRVKTLEEEEIERRSAEINSFKDDSRMFQAVRELTRGKTKTLTITNDEGETVAKPEAAAELVAKYFSSLFYDPLRSECSQAEKKTLNTPITTEEVIKATKKLRNGRAVGPDGIPGELLKYGPASLSKNLADIFNKMFEDGEDLELGHGTLIVLPKPGKPAGQMGSLRPIVLLNTLRKTLSLIALHRIRPAVETFLPKSQSGFRQHRSTSDAVWTHKWMIARIMKVREEILILGIDMSRAFDTIDRALLLAELRAIVDEDSWRIIRALLSDTKLEAKLQSALSQPFKTNIGAPQGDSLSPVLFVIYLELAMRQIRKACPRPQRDNKIPTEIIYADDTDFISTSRETLANIETNASSILKTWYLAMNCDKTELTTLKREKEKEDETWRKTKKLGTLLGDTEEMRRRKQLASVAYGNMMRIWGKNNKIRPEKRIMLYNTYITPILTYNSCTWALTETELEELEAFRRKQLRSVIGIRYPRTISNAKLYELCGVEKLEHIIRGSRWRMLGHVLRMEDETPAKYATINYFEKGEKAFLGRPRTSLVTVISEDLKLASVQQNNENTQLGHLPSQLKSIADLKQLETIAKERTKWKTIVANMHVLMPPQPTRLIPHRNVKQ